MVQLFIYFPPQKKQLFKELNFDVENSSLVELPGMRSRALRAEG